MSATVFRSSAHALITGGASGVGLAVTQLCLKHGMKVSIVDVNASTLEATKKNLSGDVQCVQADVGEKESWKKIRGEVGDVDFLMLNAGIGGIGMKAGWGEDEGMEKVWYPVFINGVVNCVGCGLLQMLRCHSDHAHESLRCDERIECICSLFSSPIIRRNSHHRK